VGTEGLRSAAVVVRTESNSMSWFMWRCETEAERRVEACGLVRREELQPLFTVVIIKDSFQELFCVVEIESLVDIDDGYNTTPYKEHH
jgi:hypothetical protein